ncbi:hypothetical protein SAMN02799624_01374 [Paenibacillus sp. UNC496MF]|uniref:hypothetical protein n=1 Tax=Paenibacillus sp. UNC496MF TaxID=1502753 RepID=UPI0008E95D8F|nr:hypothetical protein [Paenibacillus sp. UNC496MF]SFI55967.1 hypothetical protein SAMN02799624_01374 [Paenibacillus sp. UNC496MF]
MKGFRSAAAALVLVCTAVLLSGCLYPRDRLEQNQKPPKDAILNVQTIVDQFQKDTGLLPIQNSDEQTPVYEKFKVDFDKLQRMNYLSAVPASAYEKGGSYYYLVINEEKDPTVKLMNLVIYQKANDLQASVKAYAGAHGGKLPAGQQLYPSFAAIDFKALGVKDPELRSVFTGSVLTAMTDPDGTVYLDYGPDLMQQLGKLPGGEKPEPDADLRTLLVDGSDFVPVKSPLYKLVNGEPQAVLK